MQKPPDNFIIAPPKRYWVAQTRTTKYFSISTIPEIAALLNAKLISEDFMATEHNRFVHSYDKVLKNEAAVWVKVLELLAEAYKDKPLITVVLKDIENDTLAFSERYHSNNRPRQVAGGAIEIYFNQHYKDYAEKSPKKFLVYFMSDTCPATVMTVQLEVGDWIAKTGIIGSKYAPFEEVHHYAYDESDCRILESPSEFPPVALELKPAKYDPTAMLPPGFRSSLAT
jgi:hypothetical protein